MTALLTFKMKIRLLSWRQTSRTSNMPEPGILLSRITQFDQHCSILCPQFTIKQRLKDWIIRREAKPKKCFTCVIIMSGGFLNVCHQIIDNAPHPCNMMLTAHVTGLHSDLVVVGLDTFSNIIQAIVGLSFMHFILSFHSRLQAQSNTACFAETGG